jgi:aspartate aminotransferase
MLSISKRGQEVSPSPIRKLVKYADAAKAAGTKVFHLNIGQPDILTPKEAIQKVQTTDIQIVAYTPSNGMTSYREALPRYYKKYNLDISPNEIIVTNGASEGIFFTLLAALDEHDEVIVPEPFYANYNGFCEMANVAIKPITSSIDNGFALPSLSDFEQAISPKTKAILLCNPNNPTGCVYDEKTMRALIQLVKKNNMYLMVDEVYREFCYQEEAFFSALSLSEIEENVVVFDSISKRYSSCGARVGAIVSRNQTLLEVIIKYAELRLSVPTFGQILAESLVDTPETYMNEVKSEYISRRNLLFERLSAIQDVKCYLPQGAFYILAELPIDDSDAFCQWLLESFQYKDQTIMLAPATGFYANKHLGKKQVRIAYVLNKKDLNSAMDCLEVALKAYQQIKSLF